MHSTTSESTVLPATAAHGLKIVVVGGFGVGKTTLVRAVSEIRPLNTEETMTQAGAGVDSLHGIPNKSTTTVAFDFGRIHVGVARGLSKRIITDDRTSLQLGFDKMLGSKFQFAVDYYTGKNAVAGIQPTLYYYINDKADFGLGWYRMNMDVPANRNQIYACFDYNFDFNAKK